MGQTPKDLDGAAQMADDMPESWQKGDLEQKTWSIGHGVN